MNVAVQRECLAVRDRVALFDASTLGKIEISGRDAGRFLDRITINHWQNLAIGHCRYGVMCREDGMVFDDGVGTRLAPDRFFLTTTTGNAAAVIDWLEEWLQTEWPELEVFCTSLTEEWANATLVGPRAREVLGALAPRLGLDRADFPFMRMREADIAGIPARIFRVSFSGELSYEINVPSDQGLSLWEQLIDAGAPYGITPYGTEAMHVLRAEKGYVIVGQETDGSVTPIDLGLGALVSPDPSYPNRDFLGRRSLARSDTARANRKQLVGLLPDNPEEILPEGAQLVAELGGTPPLPMIGHVTSSYYGAPRPQLRAGAGRSRPLAPRRAGLGPAPRPHHRRPHLSARLLRPRRAAAGWLKGAIRRSKGCCRGACPQGRTIPKWRSPNCVSPSRSGCACASRSRPTSPVCRCRCSRTGWRACASCARCGSAPTNGW